MGNLALNLRADPVGGVTGISNANVVAFAVPLQIQGLTNVTPAAAGKPAVSAATAFTFLLVAPAVLTNDSELPLPEPTADASGEAWPPWLDAWTWQALSSRRLSTPATAIASPGQVDATRIEPELLPVPLGTRNRSSVGPEPTQAITLVPLDEVAPATVSPAQSQTTALASPGTAPSAPAAKEPARGPLPWIAVLAGTAAAACFMLSKTFRPVEARQSLSGSNAEEPDGTVGEAS